MTKTNPAATLARMTTWRGSRRAAIGGALGGALGAVAGAGVLRTAAGRQSATPAASSQATPEATPDASPVAGGNTPHLFVADREAASISIYSIPGFELTGQLDEIGFGIHGGSLLLEDGRLLFADTLNNEIVALTVSADGVPEIAQRVPATLGGGVAWISADPSLRYLVAGSLVDEQPTQHLNIVDLQTFDNTALEFEMAEQEEIHGWLLGDPLHLHVAIGGQIDSYLLSDLIAGTMEPLASVPVELGSHGGATDARNERILYTTGPGAGFEVLDVSGGAATYETQIPWDVDGLAGGRNARPRMLRDGVHIFGVMTPALDDPSLWAETMVSNHITNVDDLTAVRLPIDVGTLGYRWGLSAEHALWAGYNAEGARAYLLDANPESATFGTAISTIEITMPSNAATPGQDYADTEFYIMTAITPDGAWGFVTISGDGLIQAIDLHAGSVVADIAVPSPLAGGGYTTVVQAGITPVDLWAR